MLASYIRLDVAGDGRGGVGLGAGPVRADADEVHDQGKADATGEVGEEEEGAGGDADEHDRPGRGAGEVEGDAGGEVGDTVGDLGLCPQDTIDVVPAAAAAREVHPRLRVVPEGDKFS